VSLFSHHHPVLLPAQVWFWFFSYGYLFNMENSAVLREKTPPQQENVPHFHFMLFSLPVFFKVRDERLFSTFPLLCLKR
jgi:hypothetical protein